MSILDHIGATPTIALPRVGADLPVPLYGKCEHLNPGGSIKDRIAKAIIEDAEARGALRPGATLIEATAGNTGIGLALVAAIKGYRLVCVMPEKMSEDKRAALRAVGAELIITANAPPTSPENFQNVARKLANEREWFLTDQFVNEANAKVHEQTTGPEILAAVPDVKVFVAGAGTGGTITGVARYLKPRGVQIVLADPEGSGLAEWVRTGEPGPDGTYSLEGIGSSVPPEILDRTLIDHAVTVSDAESYAVTRRLITEEGLLVGGSAGAAVAGALRMGAEAEGPVVAMLPDSWDRYMSKDWLQPTSAP